MVPDRPTQSASAVTVPAGTASRCPQAASRSKSSAGLASANFLLATMRMSETTKPSLTGSLTAPSMPETVMRSSAGFCDSLGMILGTLIHMTSLPGFSLKIVQLGAHV